jgi:secondary thiamine-phosphate synthase enzyme
METLATTFVYRHTRLRIRTEQATEFIDITDRVAALAAEAGLRLGLINVQALHTTAAVVVNEHEPRLLEDFLARLEALAPRNAAYRHDADPSAAADPEQRANGHAHCQALFLTPAACLNVVDGRLLLGRWQRIFLVELDGPRARELAIVMAGEGCR